MKPTKLNTKVTKTSVVALITLLLALAAFFLMAFRKIPEIVFWIIIIPCAAIAYWIVPKMKKGKE